MPRPAFALALALSVGLLNACSSSHPAPRATAALYAPAGGPESRAERPEDRFETAGLAAHLRFLASDELMGRKAGTLGNDVAARYIAEQFRAAGVQPVPGAADFFQPVPLERTAPPREAHLVLFGDTLRQGRALLVLGGQAVRAEEPVVFAGYGLSDGDYRGLDAAGKIVVTQAGRPDDRSPQAALRSVPEKQQRAAAHGARALVELYAGPLPWSNLARHLAAPRFGLAPEATPAAALPLAWVHDANGRYAERLRAAAAPPQAAFRSAGLTRTPAASNNVVGRIEGADPARRDEYVVLMAHYDHVGAGLRNGPGATPADSIFNGARDNGMGVVALLGAARALTAERPARSVLLLAVTAEEDGLLGSRYYVEHPLLPLRQMVYVLNVDGAGFSDPNLVTVIGLGRTSADSLLHRAGAAYGIEIIGDPAPEQGLFDRSDNVNFARAGVPAPTFSPGFRSFSDPGVADYYHRPQDEADDRFDYEYLRRFVQAYTRAARLIADSPQRPTWRPGDPYEAAGRALYDGR